MNKTSLHTALELQTRDVATWAIKAHADTNHYYDEYLPYEFHLRMVVKNVMDFIDLIVEQHSIESGIVVINGGWCHDTIEDARQNYNSVKKVAGIEVAEIARACTNYGRGRNRDERMPDFVYKDIHDTPFAVIVKVADRMANGQYSKMTGSSMYQKYVKEHGQFTAKLFSAHQGDLWHKPMWHALDQVFGY